MKIIAAILIALFVTSCSFDMETATIRKKESISGGDGNICFYNSDLNPEFIAPCDWYYIGDKIAKYKTIVDSLSKIE